MAMSRGQMTIVGILVVFTGLIVFAALLPSMNAVITAALPDMDEGTSTIVNLIPMFMAVAILGSIFIYSTPQYQG